MDLVHNTNWLLVPLTPLSEDVLMMVYTKGKDNLKNTNHQSDRWNELIKRIDV